MWLLERLREFYHWLLFLSCLGLPARGKTNFDMWQDWKLGWSDSKMCGQIKKILKSINLIKICSNNFIYLSSLLNKTLLLWLIVTILFHIKQIFYLINCTFFMRQKIKYCHSWWVVGFICNNNIFYQVTFD